MTPPNLRQRSRARAYPLRRVGALVILTSLVALLRAPALSAAAGDIVADVDATPFATFGVSVAFDGQFLYFTNFNESIMHRIDVPPPGTSVATGHMIDLC